MSRRAALAGAALALGAFDLIVEPISAGTVEIHSPLGPGCCSISDGSMLQSDPAGGLATVDKVWNDGAEKTDDPLALGAFAFKESGGSGGNSLDAVSSVAAPEPSVLTRLLIIFSDLRATVFRNPASGP
jgi:hypothetical protein